MTPFLQGSHPLKFPLVRKSPGRSGGTPDKALKLGTALLKLGYKVRVFIDADKPSTPAVFNDFMAARGEITTWQPPRALEDELFLSLPDKGVNELLDYAVELLGDELVDAHIKSCSNGESSLEEIRDECLFDGFSSSSRELLAKASKNKTTSWFKKIAKFEVVAHEIVGPNLAASDANFVAIVDELKGWMHAT